MEGSNSMLQNKGENDITSEGFSRYGNFNNYYNFHPAENRIRLLPDYFTQVNVTEGKVVCLDVGCNIGVLTHALHKHITSRAAASNHVLCCHILAIDFDQSLIEEANNTNQNKLITFQSADVLTDYFEQLCQSYLEGHDKKYFDIIYCFSITMWIHINYGDDSLKQFLQKLCEKTDMLIIEPQPWKCYTKAARKMKRSNNEPFKEFNNLKIRQGIEDYIESFVTKILNFSKVLHSAPTKWGRQISIYKKR